MDAFIQFFKQHLDKLDQHYAWPKFVPKAVPKAPWVFKTTGAAECIAMKHHLTETWAKADAIERGALANWIVANWGGVRANTPETIANYVTAIGRSEYPTTLQGVASYSKILSVVNCRQFAIYDARVAAALNAVQVLYEASERHFFAPVPSRNKTIREFTSWFPDNELSKRTWIKVPRNDTYATYTRLLHDLKAHVENYEIYHFEMVLFSIAPILCKRAMQGNSAQVTMISPVNGEN